MKQPNSSHHALRASVLGFLLLASQPLMADLKVTFSAGGDNTTPTGTITVNLGTTSASMSNLTGGGGLNAPNVSGALAGLSGSFDINFQALGTVADTFDPSDFTGGATNGIHSTVGTWAVNSDLNTLPNNVPGQGIVFTFDFTNLVGASEIDLKAVRWNNDGGGCRLSFRDEGVGTSTALHSGGGVNSADQTITFSPMQSIDSDDQVAFWSGGGGQKRLAEFTFSYTPSGVVPPTNLTATTNGAQVNLNWDDDLSGTLDFYTLKRSETPGGPYTQVATGLTASDYIDTTVATGTTYYYVVTATDTLAFETANSNEASIYVRIQPPTGLTRTQGDGVIDLDWNDDTSGILDFYTVYRSETSGGLYTEIATDLTASSYSDNTVTNGTTYFYVVTATDDVVALESLNSAQVSGTPFTPVAGPTLYAHLDGSDGGSVTADVDEIVSLWADLTANGFDATSTGGAGTVFYPSLDKSETWLNGVDFGFTTGTSRSTLYWFSPAEQDTWLDFSSGANALPYGGFTILTVVYPDTILGGTSRDVVLSSIESKFSLRYENGRPQMRLGSTVLQGTAGAVTVGKSVVLAVNYDATTGQLELWDSSSGNTSTATVAAADFSATDPLYLGGSINADQYMKGFIGEMKIYRGAMTPEEFISERGELTFKWAGLQAPSGLAASSGDGTLVLDWNDQIADFYTVYRSEVEGGPHTQVATNLPTSDWTDTAVTDGTTYYYVVSATKDLIESPLSAELAATPYTSVPGSTLYVHLDATNAASVVTSGSIVNQWNDQTANGNNALEVPNGAPPVANESDTGDVLYPSTSLSASGLAGLDFGIQRNLLNLFEPAAQDTWLNFTDANAALPYSGFTVFIALKADSILGAVAPNQARDVVFANAEAITGKFVIRYQNGRPEMYLNGVAALQGVNRVVAGDTVILAANYDAETGNLEFWDSKSGISANATVPKADFSSSANMFLGGSLNTGQRMDGMIGEVKIYRGAMDASSFEAERDALVTKWIGATGGFSAWQTANSTAGGLDEDHDGDGVANGIEYFLGGDADTTGFTALPGVDASGGIRSVTWTKASSYGGTYGIDFWVETSATLAPPWTQQNEDDTVTIDGDEVTFTFPAGTKNFARLRVTGP